MIKASRLAAALLPFWLGAGVAAYDGTELVVPKRDVAGAADGILTAGEYGAPHDLAHTVTGTFRIQAHRSGGQEELRFYFEIFDAFTADGDEIRISFDLDHDHAAGPADRGIRIRRRLSPSLAVTTVNQFGDPSDLKTFGGPACDATAFWCIVEHPNRWIAEVRVPVDSLGLNEFPSLSGMHILVLAQASDGTIQEGRFPAVPVNQIASWTNLKTRHPIAFMISLDHSGSMLSNQKWDNAKRAADIFATTMSALRDPAFDDRIGLVTFSWLCSGSNQTATQKPLAPVGAFPFANYTSGIVAPLPNFCTPIGEGLKQSFTELNATAPDDVAQLKRGVLLLSDGLQNRPGPSFAPNETGYDPCPGEPGWGECRSEVSNVSVSTVAFGEGDWQVDTDLLSDIQRRYQGTFAFPVTTFNLSSDPLDLVEDFLTGLEDFYTTNLVYTGAPAAFPIDPGNSKLVVIAAWTTPAEAAAISLQRGGTPVNCVQSSSSTTAGLAICSVNNPEAAANWQAVFSGAPPQRLFVVLDLRLRARFATAPIQPGTGDPILLTVELRDAGQPVLHHTTNHPVRVTARVSKPGESVGTFASTHQPRTCEVIRPVLPPPPVVIGSTVPRPAPFASAAPTAPLVQQVGDPDPPLFQHVQGLLSACGREDLGRESTPGLVLRDDGTGGDEVAGDGIYSALYTDTRVEGTYVVHFEVEGTTAEGHPFTRTKRQATYVRLRPDHAASDIGSRILSEHGNIVEREFYILPRDRFGGYLGMGRGRKVDFVLDRGPGTFVGDVVDYGTGYYARRIRYDRTQGEPIVTPIVDGERVERRQPRPPSELGIYAGGTFFADALGLSDALVLGARLGYRLLGPVVFEIEGGATFIDAPGDDSGHVVQALANLRLDLGAGRLVPFATGGAGVVAFRGLGTDAEALLLQAGGGAHLWLSDRFGLRADVRVLRFDEVFGAGVTTNYQATAGLVIRP